MNLNDLPLGPYVSLIKQDMSGLIAFSKPCGVRSHPNGPDIDLGALLQVPYNLNNCCYQLAGNQRLYLINRLDSPTSGIVLATFDPDLAAHMQSIFQNNQVRKTYYALVKGRPTKPKGVWRIPLAKVHTGGHVRSALGGGTATITEFEHVSSKTTTSGTISLLRLRPVTGKTHQLRVHCAQHQLPIVGDMTYGDFKFNRSFAKMHKADRLFLHAESLQIEFTYQHVSWYFMAKVPVPELFTAVQA